MPFLLAMSAFQSRTQDDAFDRLLAHIDDGQVQGIQLTPGNLPSLGFQSRIESFIHRGGLIRVHQGFSWTHYRREVLDADGKPLGLGLDHSIHAPRIAPKYRTDVGPFIRWNDWLQTVVDHDLLVETMYPGYALGSGNELESAMDAGVRLCVDIAHLSIQSYAGELSAATLKRLFNYERVSEVHVSHSTAGKDTHSPISAETPWLGWARERIGHIPVVLESYWHKLDFAQQRMQVQLAVNC